MDNLNTTQAGQGSGVKPLLREIVGWAMAVVIALAAAFIINRFVIINALVPSESMEPAIMTGDRVIGLRFSYAYSAPQRGDVVIFRFPDDETQLYVKRIIGLPGDVLEVRQGRVYLNGSVEPLEEDYVQLFGTDDHGPYTVPEDAYFMMGDNRTQSLDSRYWQNTYVRREKVLGRAAFRIFPKPGRIV